MDTIRDILPSTQKSMGYGVVDPVMKKKSTAPKRSPLSLISPFFIRLMAAIVIFLVLFLVCASLIRSMQQKPVTLSEQLVAKITTTIEVLDVYNSEIHSSMERTLAVSLRDSLNGTRASMVTYLTNNHNYDEDDAEDSEVWASELAIAEELSTELENARLNGILDSVYIREMTLVIYEIEGIESEIIERTSSTELDSTLENSISSLDNIISGFEALDIND